MFDFNQKFYVVYNVLTFSKKRNDSVYPMSELVELYSLLINSPYVVTVENHVADDGLGSELRVIFWSEDAYNKWAEDNRQRYDEIVESFHHVHQTDSNVTFERYTSLDNYISKYPYTNYPLKNELIDWTLIPFHKAFMIENILPIGKILEHLGNGELTVPKNVKGEGSRFIKERTSDIVRRPLSAVSTKDKNFPSLLAYSFDQTIITTMYTAPWLYRKLSKLTSDAEMLASQYITDCDNAAVLIGHKSLGNELTLHTHRISDAIKYTFTICVRLTFNGKGAKLKFYQPLDLNDPNLNKYYYDPRKLYDHINGEIPEEIYIKDRTNILVFSASLIPHTVEYDDDIFLFYVYDNVTFKEEKFEQIKSLSTTTYFNSHPENSRLYYYQYTALE